MGVSHNSIGVHAPEGLGSFCLTDYESATQLHGFTVADAVARLREEFDSGGDVSCRVGSWFGPFRLLRLLGRGQLARVYEAEHTVKRVNVALKVISPRHSQDQSFRLRMQRNVAAVARIRNAVPEPQIVPIFDWGEINERPYVVMPVVDGIDLERSLAHDGRFSPAQAVGLLGQIASALDALHSQGWMHRNVRPNNIIVGRDLTSLLSGFQYLTVDLGGHTHPMNYAYSAPEEFTNDGTTFRTDIYALTCVFYECLTGDPPYRGDSMEAVIRGHIQQPAPRPSSNAFPADIPASLDDVIACGMAKEPDRRYASAGALALAARQALAASGRA